MSPFRGRSLVPTFPENSGTPEDRDKAASLIDPEIILESLEEGVLAIGLDRKILYMNKAAREMLSVTPGQEKSIDCQKALKSSSCQTRCLLEKTIATGETIRNHEITIFDRSHKIRTIRVNTALLKRPDGELIGGVEIFHDVTQILALKEEIKGRYSFGRIIGRSQRMQELYDILPIISNGKSTILIEGESGTGKELVANAIHESSSRKEGPFVKLNCAALSEGVLESELFGHVKGAFTGAVQSRPGRFEIASGGTLFLDEIGEISPSMQVKLLRVLQEEEFERVGGTHTIKVDVRVIAATNRDLKQAMEKGEFRKDLYYRLRVIPVTLVPLRDRKEDIPLLINAFIEKFSLTSGKEISGMTPEAMGVLLNYSWPGNIRELQNAVEHAVLLSPGGTIDLKHLPSDIVLDPGEIPASEIVLETSQPLRKVKDDMIRKTLEMTGGNISEAARKLEIGRSTLWRRLREMDQG